MFRTVGQPPCQDSCSGGEDTHKKRDVKRCPARPVDKKEERSKGLAREERWMSFIVVFTCLYKHEGVLMLLMTPYPGVLT